VTRAPEKQAESATAVEPTGDGSRELSWRSYPARRSLARTATVVVILIALFAFISWYTASLFMGLVLTMVVALSLASYFTPTWYTLTDEGIAVRTLVTKMQRPWSVYRSCWPDKNGVLLSPFPHPSRLENFRGVFIRFEDNRDEVVRFVCRFVPRGEA
jgi:hypothetical protein